MEQNDFDLLCKDLSADEVRQLNKALKDWCNGDENSFPVQLALLTRAQWRAAAQVPVQMKQSLELLDQKLTEYRQQTGALLKNFNAAVNTKTKDLEDILAGQRDEANVVLADSKGKTWGLDGNLFWYLIGGSFTSVVLMLLLFSAYRMSFMQSAAVAVVPLTLTLVYLDAGGAEKEQVTEIATLLLPWCREGNYGCLFDGISNLSLTGKIAHFELGYIPESAKELKTAAGFLITNDARKHIMTLPRAARKRNVYEEVARFLDIPGGEEIVKESYAQLRKFNCWNISIVQQYARFKQSRIRSAVFGNSRQFYLMRQNDRADLDDIRHIEDIDSRALTYAEVKAIASGNPLVMEKATVDAEITRLTRLRSQHAETQYRIRDEIRHLKEKIPFYEKRIENLKLDIKQRVETRGEKFEIVIEKATVKDRAIAGELLNRIARRVAGGRDEYCAGTFAGFELIVRPAFLQQVEIILKGHNHYSASVSDSPIGTIRSLEYVPQNFEERLSSHQRDLKESEKKCRELESKIGQPFEHGEKLQSLCQRQKELEDALDITKNQASNALAAEETEVQTVKEIEGESMQETPDKISHLKNMVKTRIAMAH